MQTFTVEPKTHQLRPSSGEKLNFRLWAQNTPSPLWSIIRKKNTGTWTVWNLKTLGDEFIIPLRRLPSQRPSQLKIGFEGCVLRVPAVYKQVPRAVVELGFWDPRGDGMRRTVVVEYLTGNFKMELKDVTVVQQKAIPRQASFVGDMSVEEDIQMLPQKTPFGMTDVIQTPIKNSMEPIRMERVELQSMTRTTTNRAKMASDEKEKAWKVLGCLLSHDDDSYSMVLPNGLLTCLPKQLQTTVTNSFVFAHSWSHKRPLQAVHIEFDPTTSQAIAATMYSYEQTRKS